MIFLQRKAFQVLVLFARNETEEAENDDVFPPGIFFNHRRPWYFRVPKSLGVQGVKSGSYVEILPTWEAGLRIFEDFAPKNLGPNGKNLHDVYREILSESAVRSKWTGASVVSTVRCADCAWKIVGEFAPFFFLSPALVCLVWQGPLIGCLGGWVFKFTVDVFSFRPMRWWATKMFNKG